MSAEPAVVQLNVRLPRELKERGDATLSAVGSSPAKIIRQLWSKLAAGGEEYERVARVLAEEPRLQEGAQEVDEALNKATSLFANMGDAFGLDVATFVPDGRSDGEVLEELDWRTFEERGLA